jgi:hypothetical protein
VSDLAAIADRLESIVADLDEVALDRLREAVADGATAPARERQDDHTGAPAIEKAAHLLRSVEA